MVDVCDLWFRLQHVLMYRGQTWLVLLYVSLWFVVGVVSCMGSVCHLVLCVVVVGVGVGGGGGVGWWVGGGVGGGRGVQMHPPLASINVFLHT